MSLKFIQNIIYMTVLCCHVRLKFLCIFAIILLGFIFRWRSIIFESWFKNSYSTASFKTFWAVYNEKTFFCKIFIYELGQINYIYISKSFILLEFYYLVKMFNLYSSQVAILWRRKWHSVLLSSGLILSEAKKKSNTWNFWYHLGIRIWILLVELLDYCGMVLFSF